MADVNANIGVNIDTSAALAQLKALQRQIAQFHTSFVKSSEAAQLAQKGFATNLINSINSIGAFNAELRTIKTTAESFTDSLQKNKFSMREYFRYAGGATKTFGKLFKSEFDTIGKVAEENVKRLQTQYIKLGRDSTGAMKAIAVTPKELDLSNYSTQIQVAAQKQAILNQLLKQGSTNLLNFGKNTQWAGRQLMVGFTLPLAALGTTASRTFFDMETAAIKFRKVYGDLFTPQAEREQALAAITELGQGFTKYGIAVKDTISLAAEAAAAGFKGIDLQRQTEQATRLQVLGQIDAQKALETTISLQNAFQLSSENLADSINFLNAVENQTVVSLDDITTAIPKVAPVIQQLGGNVKDLAFFLAAMKEGGVDASEGANALKSGLAALINPTNKASALLKSAGININQIIEANKGNLKATVIAFAKALDTLDPLSRARAIEQLFGKFQFARLSTLFENVTKVGNQASRVLELANASAGDLASTAEQELGITANSAMNKFRKTVEDLKLALAPVGKSFIEAVTPLVEFIRNILEKFNNLSNGTKKLITLLTIGLGAVGPVLLMTFGLIANGAANLIKLFLTLRNGYLRLTGQSNILSEQTQYLTVEQQQAASVAAGLNQSHNNLIQTFNAEAGALANLISVYQRAIGTQSQFMAVNPTMFFPKGKGFADGIVSVPGPKGAGDVVPAMLSPGEAVIPSDMAQRYAPLIQGMVAGNIPGFRSGRIGSGAEGRVGKSGITVPIPYGQNVRATGGAVDFLNIDPQDIVNITSIYTKQIIQSARVSVAQIDAEIKQWRQANSNAINQATQLVNQGISAETAFGPVIEKFNTDMQNAGGAVSRFSQQATQLMPTLQEDLIQAQQEAQRLGLNIKNAADAIRLQQALPSNILAQTAATPGNFTALAKSRQAAASMFGGAAGVGQYGIPRFMISEGIDTKSLAYLQGSSQEHFSTTRQQELQRTALTTARRQARSVVESALEQAATTAQVASPSKRTIKIGEDIASGLSVGMKQGEPGVRQSAQRLSNVAVGGVRNIPFSNKPAGSAPMSTVAANLPVTTEELNNSFKNVSTRATQFDAKMSTLNAKLMGGSFALTGLTTALSFMDGGVGKFSGTIAKVSGAMFALMTVTQLLTQTKIAQLASDRLSLARSAVSMARGTQIGEAIGVAGKSAIAGRAGMLGGLARAGIFITRFLGPIGLATTALFAAYKIIQLTNAARERERQAIEGLGKAANLSKDQIKKLGDIYNVTPTQSPLDLAKPTVAVSSAQRQQIQQTKEAFQNDKTFQSNIAALKNVTQQQADVVFQSIATKLAGSGFGKEAINNILIALQEEAGRTDLKINFKNFDLTTPEGVRSLEQNAGLLATKFGTSFEKGFSEYNWTDPYYGITSTITTLSKELKTDLATAANSLAAQFSGISGQFANGTINGKQFSDSLYAITNNIKSLGEQKGLMLMTEALKTVGSEAAIAASQVGDLQYQATLLEAIMLGIDVTKTTAILTTAAANRKAYEDYKSGKSKIAVSLDTSLQESARIAESELEKINKNAKKTRDVINKSAKGTGTIQDTRTEKQKYDDLFSVINTFFSAQEALIRQNRQSEEDLLQAKVDNAQTAVDKTQEEIDKKQELINLNQHEIDLINRRIDLDYDRPLQKLSDESTILNNNLSLIENTTKSITEKYDAQEKALNAVAEANQQILDQEKARLNIAGALTTGDIAAAAQAVQESRAQAASGRIGQTQAALQRARDAAIAGVTVGGMTKDQIEKRLFDISQQSFNLEQQKKALQEQIVVLQDKNYSIEQEIYNAKQNSLIPQQKIVDEAKKALETYNKQTDALVNNITYQGKTANQWTEINNRISAAQASIDLINKVSLADMEKSMNNILSGWTAIQGKIASATTGTASPLASSTTGNLGSSSSRISQRVGDLLGLGLARGGYVPKYMAVGGRVGSDSVPAMLTPGEFVVNKFAARRFGPLLESLNESKYPSMLSNAFGGTVIPLNNINSKVADNSTAVYNYSLGFNISGNNLKPSDISRAVINEIRRVDQQRIRGIA